MIIIDKKEISALTNDNNKKRYRNKIIQILIKTYTNHWKVLVDE